MRRKTMFKFSSPYYFILLIPLAAGAWAVLREKKRRGLLFPSAYIPARSSSWRTSIARAAPLLYLLGLLSVIIALARPRNILSTSTRNAEVIAIQMIADVSGSMRALDMSTKTEEGWKYRTRLDAVKEAFRNFVKQRPHDLTGLITFGGYATTLCPLTLDHQALVHILEGVEIPDPEVDTRGQPVNPEELMTAVGDALATACARLEEVEAKSKIAVLLSDGESNTGAVEPAEAARAAKKLGIKVYTIGVGTTGYADFIVDTPLGSRKVRREVVLDEKLLRSIAAETGGRYFNVRDKEALAKALEEIDKLEKTRIEQAVYYQYDELFGWFLLPGIIFIAAGTCLNMFCAQRIV